MWWRRRRRWGGGDGTAALQRMGRRRWEAAPWPERGRWGGGDRERYCGGGDADEADGDAEMEGGAAADGEAAPATGRWRRSPSAAPPPMGR